MARYVNDMKDEMRAVGRDCESEARVRQERTRGLCSAHLSLAETTLRDGSLGSAKKRDLSGFPFSALRLTAVHQ